MKLMAMARQRAIESLLFRPAQKQVPTVKLAEVCDTFKSNYRSNQPNPVLKFFKKIGCIFSNN